MGAGVGYLWMLALASVSVRRVAPTGSPWHRFAIAIAAHNEAAVIGRTVSGLRQLDYPAGLYDVFVVADHCEDNTAELARLNGATCHERVEGPRGSKGAALAWLLERIFSSGTAYDAIALFDADTQVHPAFLRVMDACLARGDEIVQGRHRIGNPQAGWFAALTWAMFMVDNRFQNQGRSNLGFSAKLMGDSVCFRADLLRRLGWGTTGLTEDYELRLRLLLQGVRIRYEPAAVGDGEAPSSWTAARAQRARWLQGSYQAGRRLGWTLLREGVRRRDLALLDGAAQSLLPSYSTLTLASALVLLVHLALGSALPGALVAAWATLVMLLAVYPLFGLYLERAPVRAYVVILSGPVFIVWRTWLSLVTRFSGKTVRWVRTDHGGR